MKYVVSRKKMGPIDRKARLEGGEAAGHRKMRGFPKIPRLTWFERSSLRRLDFRSARPDLKKIPAFRPTVTVRFGSLSILQ
jgi:hypothetical protein